MKFRDLIRLLREDGWYEVRSEGSHLHFQHQAKLGTITVPAGGKLGRDIAPGTLRSILKQAALEK